MRSCSTEETSLAFSVLESNWEHKFFKNAAFSSDNDFKEAKAGNRVGLALKGITTDELDRGMILSNGELKVAKELEVEINWNPFMQKTVKEGENYQIIVGLQSVSCNVEAVDGNKIKLSLQREIAYDVGDKLCLIDGSAKIRILGVATLE